MLFFKEFPKEKFNYNGRYTQELIDVTTRIKLLDYVKNHKDLSQVGIRSNYEIFPGQRPEEISFELYESYDYVWIDIWAVPSVNVILDHFGKKIVE